MKAENKLVFTFRLASGAYLLFIIIINKTVDKQLARISSGIDLWFWSHDNDLLGVAAGFFGHMACLLFK